MDKRFKQAHTTHFANPNNPEGIHEYYLNIIRHMPNNVYWLDRNCVTQGCNDNVLRFIGLEKLEDFVGLTYEKMGELAHWTQGQALSFKKDDEEVMRTGQIKQNIEEPVFYDKEGNPVYYISTRVPLFDRENNVIGVIGISVDISERKKMEDELRLAKEQAEAANTAKSKFIANISHDIRTPLAGLIGMANIMVQEATSEKDRKRSLSLSKAGGALLDFLNSVIEFSKLESGELPIQMIQLDMRALIDSVVTLMMPAVKEKNLTLHIQIDPSIPDLLIGDYTRLNRILLNLLGNALKFTYEGRIDIFLRCIKQEEKHIDLHMIVKDTGIGIPASQQATIFSSFEKSNFSNPKHAGYGLGLSIVKQFLSDMKGTVSIESEEGKGTSFICAFRLEKIETILDNTTPSHAETLSAVPYRKIKPKILLVEDNLLIQKIGKHQFSSLGCEIDIASSGKEALALGLKNSYDLIIMDVGLPDQKGTEVTKILREKDSLNWNTPVIALTAYADEANRQECLDAGVNEIFNKPMHEKIALEILKKYVAE